MKKGRWTKGFVICIIMLFIGTSIVPGMPGTTEPTITQTSNNELKEIRTTYTSTALIDIQTTPSPQAQWIQPQTLAIRQSEKEKYSTFQHQSVPPSFDTALMTQPVSNDVLRAGDLIVINGTASGSTFQNYVIEWGVGQNPSQWFTTNIDLVNDGLVEVIDGTLATWDTSFVDDKDFLSLKLTVYFTASSAEAYVRNICLDPSLRQGWPVRIPYEYNAQGGYYYWAGYLETVVDDIDNDGYDEIIIYKGGDPPTLNVFSVDGSLRWSAPVGTTDVSGGNLHIPLVGDLNNDGYDEIVVFRLLLSGSYCQLYVFDHTGQILTGWPINTPKEYHPTMLIADVNNDGSDEIIFQGNDAMNRKLSIIDGTGNVLAQWDLPVKQWGSSIEPTPAVGNFDADPELEIVCASPSENAGYNSSSGEWNNEGVIHVYNIDGSEVSGWPKYTQGVIFSAPVTGDINNDGDCEIIVGLQFAGNAPDYRYGGVYAFDKNGNVLPGWPFEKGWNFASSPALADFDNDGDLEIVASRLGFYTYVMHHNGTLASGWPQQTTWNDYYSPVIGDITNDGIPDILTTAGNGFYPTTSNHGGVYAWRYDGTPIPGFPKATEVDAQAFATIADIDHDGDVEIIASSDWDYDWQIGDYKFRGSLYVWDVDASYQQSTMQWPTFHHDIQRTGLYPFDSPLINLEIGNITGGVFRVRTTIGNIGSEPAYNVEWKIIIVDGLLFTPRQTNGTIPLLNPGDEETIISKPIFGLGRIIVQVTATVPENSAFRQQNATVLFFFVRLR